MVATSSYPDNARSEWVVVQLDTPSLDSAKFLCWSYAVYANETARSGGDLPFLYNSHKATIRESHQKRSLEPDGRQRHVSGALVLPQDMDGFFTNDTEAYRWVEKWVDEKGRTLAPFLFPSYAGVTEELDPQWLRERIVVPIAQQITETQENYLQGVQARRLSGDRRGTTIDAQVGASGDDGRLYGTSFASTAALLIGKDGSAPGNVCSCWMRHPGLHLVGATIDTAYIRLYEYSSAGSTAKTNIFADDQAAAAAPTSTSEYNAITTTSTFVAWDDANASMSAGFNNSPEIKTVIQELVDSYTTTVIQIMHKDDNTVTAYAGNYIQARDYDHNTAQAAILHIEASGILTFTPKAIMF